jgi:hypothetical protein
MELPEKMRLNSARKIAVSRINTLRVFLSVIEDETGERFYQVVY